MKSVLISIQPKWCGLIARGNKTAEIRKTKPNAKELFKVYIYCTQGKPNNPHDVLEIHSADGKIRKGNGMVIGEFICGGIIPLFNIATDDWQYLQGNTHEFHKQVVTNCACLTEKELHEYSNGKNCYAWEIESLIIYDEPKYLSDFKVRVTNKIWSFTKKIERPPQSWCYVED